MSWIEDVFLQSQLYFRGKKAPAYWGNHHWYDEDDFLFPVGKVSRLNPNWINYKKLPEGSTAVMLQEGHTFFELRHRYNRQIMELLLENVDSVPKEERVCLMTSGGTASGKTSAVDEVAGEESIVVEGALRIDHDRLKRLLPEYELMISLKIVEASAYVQAEAGKLAAKLFKRAFAKGVPLIFEQTLENSKIPLENIRDLKKKGYEVIVAATHVTEAIGQERALTRAAKIGRYVPPDVVSRIYRGVPRALFDIREKVDSVYLFDNNGSGLRLMFTLDKQVGPQILDADLYDRYLATVGADNDLRL